MRRAWFAMMGTMVMAVSAAAQDTPRSVDRVVSGVVFDSVSGQPVSNATLYVQGRRDEYTTDSYGRFKISGIHVQDPLLIIRRIGYVPARVSMPISASPIGVDLGAVRVKQVATRLDQIQVEAEEVNRYPQLADFYRRKN